MDVCNHKSMIESTTKVEIWTYLKKNDWFTFHVYILVVQLLRNVIVCWNMWLVRVFVYRFKRKKLHCQWKWSETIQLEKLHCSGQNFFSLNSVMYIVCIQISSTEWTIYLISKIMIIFRRKLYISFKWIFKKKLSKVYSSNLHKNCLYDAYICSPKFIEMMSNFPK